VRRAVIGVFAVSAISAAPAHAATISGDQTAVDIALDRAVVNPAG
jgi:hypothetical protein